MLTIKNLTVKNFMSVGNSAQSINFANKNLVLVIGENLDLGGDDAGARNGTGKTTISRKLIQNFSSDFLAKHLQTLEEIILSIRPTKEE